MVEKFCSFDCQALTALAEVKALHSLLIECAFQRVPSLDLLIFGGVAFTDHRMHRAGAAFHMFPKADILCKAAEQTQQENCMSVCLNGRRRLSEGLAWSGAGERLQHLTALTIEGGKTGGQDAAFWQALGDMTSLTSLSLGGRHTGALQHHPSRQGHSNRTAPECVV